MARCKLLDKKDGWALYLSVVYFLLLFLMWVVSPSLGEFVIELAFFLSLALYWRYRAIIAMR